MTFPKPPRPKYPRLLPDPEHEPSRSAEFGQAYLSHWQSTPLHQRIVDKVAASLGHQTENSYDRSASAYYSSGGHASGHIGTILNDLHRDD